MDTNFIYTKTAAGEEAIRQRTRVMQRNVRMVLILVDGNSTFQDLCLRTGNVKLTENALLELEKGGFIVPALTNGGARGESRRRRVLKLPPKNCRASFRRKTPSRRLSVRRGLRSSPACSFPSHRRIIHGRCRRRCLHPHCRRSLRLCRWQTHKRNIRC